MRKLESIRLTLGIDKENKIFTSIEYATKNNEKIKLEKNVAEHIIKEALIPVFNDIEQIAQKQNEDIKTANGEVEQQLYPEAIKITKEVKGEENKCLDQKTANQANKQMTATMNTNNQSDVETKN